MTDQVLVDPLVEDGATRKRTDKSGGAKARRAKATAKKKTDAENAPSSGGSSAMAASPWRESTATVTTTVKTARKRAAGSDSPKGAANGNRSVLVAPGGDEVAANGAAGGAAKASRKRAAAKETSRGRAHDSGPALMAPQAAALPAAGAAPAAGLPAADAPVVGSGDHEEQPSLESGGVRQELPPPAAPRWAAVRKHLLSSTLAVALVVAVVLLVLTQVSLANSDSLDSARASALVAARSDAVDLASYDYRHLGQDFGKVLSESTPAFGRRFSADSKALKSVLIRYDATARAKVVAAGLVSVKPPRAIVLVFLNQTVSNTIQKTKPTTESRVEITLLRSGGRWLIDQVSLL